MFLVSYSAAKPSPFEIHCFFFLLNLFTILGALISQQDNILDTAPRAMAFCTLLANNAIITSANFQVITCNVHSSRTKITNSLLHRSMEKKHCLHYLNFSRTI